MLTRAAAPLLFALLAAGCGEGQLPSDWHSQATAEATRPIITASPSTLALSPGAASSGEVDIVNASASAVWITRASLTGDGAESFDVVSAISLPMSLVAGGTLPLYVSLATADGSATSAVLEVAQDAGASVSVTLSLAAP